MTTGAFLPSENKGFFDVDGPVSEQAIVAMAHKLIQAKLRSNVQLTSANETKKFLQIHLTELKEQVFFTVFLDAKNTVIASEGLQGDFADQDKIVQFPREVLKSAVQYGAVSVVLAHSLPVSDGKYGNFDVSITERVRVALDIIGVKTLAAYQVVQGSAVSFSDKSW